MAPANDELRWCDARTVEERILEYNPRFQVRLAAIGADPGAESVLVLFSGAAGGEAGTRRRSREIRIAVGRHPDREFGLDLQVSHVELHTGLDLRNPRVDVAEEGASLGCFNDV